MHPRQQTTIFSMEYLQTPGCRLYLPKPVLIQAYGSQFKIQDLNPVSF